MATYNGEKYLREQLNSLASQKHLPSELVVCDDGSTDATLDLLADFAITSPFPVRIYRNEINLGFAQNFLKAARLCEGEWISFCDQDDVWLPNKLDDVRAVVDKDAPPVLILQNAYICDSNLSHQNRLFPDCVNMGYHSPGSQFSFWVWLGFLQTFHSSILDFLPDGHLPRNYFPGHKYMSHDKWTCMIANATGGICVIPGPAALYRRHEQALTGSYVSQGFRDRIGKALPVGSAHYRFLSDVAQETAEYLNAISERAPRESASDFVRASSGFTRLASVQDKRARLYDSASPFQRAARFAEIVALGGYIGRPMVALGWKSLLKDLLRVVGLIGTPAQVILC